MMSPPQETEREKNICSAAFLHTYKYQDMYASILALTVFSDTFKIVLCTIGKVFFPNKKGKK